MSIYCTPHWNGSKEPIHSASNPIDKHRMEIVDTAIIGTLDLDNPFFPITKGPKAIAYDDHAIHNSGDAAKQSP
jgi:hypothetical protein